MAWTWPICSVVGRVQPLPATSMAMAFRTVLTLQFYWQTGRVNYWQTVCLQFELKAQSPREKTCEFEKVLLPKRISGDNLE